MGVGASRLGRLAPGNDRRYPLNGRCWVGQTAGVDVSGKERSLTSTEIRRPV